MRFLYPRQFPVFVLLVSAILLRRMPGAEPAPARPLHSWPIGLGLETKPTDADLTIISVLPFSPAARAGLRSGDRIVQIDAHPTAGLPFNELSKLLQGEGDSAIAFTVASAGVPLRDVRLRRGSLIERPNDIQSLRDFIAREIHFVAQIGELTQSQCDELLGTTELYVQGRGLQLSIEQHGFVRQFFLDIHGRKEFRASYVDSPEQVVRDLMIPCLKAISHSGWQKYDAECRLLAERRKAADVLAQVAAFDEALLLTLEEREKIGDLLRAYWTGMWRGHATSRMAGNPIAFCQSAAGTMDLFTISDVDLRAILRPSQIATFKLLQLPTREVSVFIQDAVRPARRFVRRGLPVEEERLRLKLWLERLVDDAAVHAGLRDDQRQRLLAAGKLDLESHFNAIAAMEERSPGARLIVIAQDQIAGTRATVPPIFATADSTFQRLFRKRLSPDQREKIAEADRDRGRFHRQAVIQLLTAGLAVRALLTDEQAERLQKLLTGEFASADAPDSLAGWRQATLKKLMDLRPEAIETLLDDWQRPAAGEYLCEIADSAIAEVVPATP